MTNKKAFSGCAKSSHLYRNILNLLFSRTCVAHVSHLNLSPLRFVSADVQVFTVTPVSVSCEVVAHDKQHLQSVRKMGFALDRGDECKLKVSLFADDTELFSHCHLD